MDNANSFDVLAPKLCAAGDYFICAVDWPGHGLSSHRSLDAQYAVTDLPWFALEASRALFADDPFTLLGHSMGGAAATLLAGAHPDQDRVAATVCIEALGPLSRVAADAPNHLQRHLSRRHKLTARKEAGARKAYPTLESCVRARLQTVAGLPGEQTMSEEAAQRLVDRGAEWDDEDDCYYFRHDAMVLGSSASYLTEEQVLAVLRNIKGPLLSIVAEQGWPHSKADMDRRAEAVRGAQRRRVRGSHHCHLDPDTADETAEAIAGFLARHAG